MPELHNHDYLFAVTDKDIRAVLYNVGTARDSDDQENTDMRQYEPTFSFLEQASLLQEECYALSEDGKKLFELLYIFQYIYHIRYILRSF